MPDMCLAFLSNYAIPDDEMTIFSETLGKFTGGSASRIPKAKPPFWFSRRSLENRNGRQRNAKQT